jgi:hypothetical protein
MAQTLSDYFPERHTERKDAALDALEAAKRANSPLDIALARKTYHMDALLHIDGDLETLRRATQECIVLARVHGPDRMLALQYNTLSEVEFAAGEYVKAMAHSRDVIRIADEVGATRSWLFALENFPHYATAAREWSAAREGAATLIRNAREAGWKTGPVYGILALAEVSAAVGDLQNAAVLLGFCLTRFGQDVHLQQTGCQAKAFAALNGSLREELDPPALQAALEAGARLTEDEAVALALASSRESRDLFTREDEDRENHSDDLTA